MSKIERKPVVYLDLNDIQQKEESVDCTALNPVRGRAALEKQYADWLDLIDR